MDVHNNVGGAWIIGYKLWCALIGRGLSSMGVLTIVPDYRNFPQGDVQDMVSDVVAAVRWTHKNARQYGGNPEKMVLAGQSAGSTFFLSSPSFFIRLFPLFTLLLYFFLI
jgi:acetyl esterase/lipase